MKYKNEEKLSRKLKFPQEVSHPKIGMKITIIRF